MNQNYQIRAADLTRIRFNERDPAASVLQNIALLLSTPKGSVPLYREYGLPVTFLDKPTPVAKRAMNADVREALQRWEPRARFISIAFEEDISQPGTLWPVVEVRIVGE